MKNKDIIDANFAEAAKGLNEIILQDKDLWYNYVINLASPLQITYTIGVFHQQVFNGGLHQYFLNSYGQFACLTVDNLKEIQAFKSAEILEKALRKVNSDSDDEIEFRDKNFNRKLDKIVNFDEDLFKELDKLDDEYYNLAEDLESLLIDYLKGFNN